MSNRWLAVVLVAVHALAVAALSNEGRAADSASVKAMFADPPREYSSGPLWVWNDLLTERQIHRGINEQRRWLQNDPRPFSNLPGQEKRPDPFCSSALALQ